MPATFSCRSLTPPFSTATNSISVETGDRRRETAWS
jgi:hypothetical protein